MIVYLKSYQLLRRPLSFITTKCLANNRLRNNELYQRTITGSQIQNNKIGVDLKAEMKPSRPSKNLGLAAVKEQGLPILESITSDVQFKAKRRLLVDDEDSGPSVAQLREANRVKIIVEDSILQHKGQIFCVGGEPIAVIDAEISPDLKQARIFWSLPFGFLLMDKLPRAVLEKATKDMQRILEKRGGILQSIVHTQMKRYNRPPMIRFVPVESEVLRKMLQDAMS